MLEIDAFAKLNLTLEVTGKRADGYHEIVSVMQTVSLADMLRIRSDVNIRFHCTDRALEDNENLVVRAAHLLKDRYHVNSGCNLHLTKHIPVAAGLAGGSSDAAAALRGLSRLWGLRVEPGAMNALAQELGSDVPFLLSGGTALVRGRGELVTPLPARAGQWYVLAKPAFAVSTAHVFDAVTTLDWSDGKESIALSRAVASGERARLGINSLQPVVFRLYPAARECYENVRAVTGQEAMISGSGPTVIGLCSNQAEGEIAAGKLRVKHYWAAVAHSVPGEETT